GQPGFIRVDTVHQGDKRDGSKGVYHINFVDEVTQWELMACVQSISEAHLLTIFEIILEQFPFIIINFHADNGSEFINKIVVKLLEKLRIKLTKSRPRQHNDNALVETKNGSVVRKHMGYLHIPKSFAEDINQWYQEWFNIYLNYHRPCAYAKRIVDKKGKEKFIYPQGDYQIPFEKLKTLKDYQKYLKPGITIVNLNKIAYALSDTDFAQEMLNAKKVVFSKIYENIRNNTFTLFK
ncbi:MAG: integrase, partial [Ignavibacteria bacterium]|nr:integrase [Ignavibacteria bacterium]